jgi:hypothetical protein
MAEESRQILREVDIDPEWGLENLIWAPNIRHTQEALERVHEVLTRYRGNRPAVVGALRGLGYRSALGEF